MATLVNLALGANLLFSSPLGGQDCCRLEPYREKYLPAKEIPYQEVQKANSNAYAIREEEIVLKVKPYAKIIRIREKKLLIRDNKRLSKGGKNGRNEYR